MKASERKKFKKKSCVGKVGFEQRWQAERALKRVNKQNFIFHQMSVYHCQFCKKFHIGKESKILYDKFSKLLPQE
jgi:hypothetical protein